MILREKIKCKVRLPNGRVVITYLNGLPHDKIVSGKIKIIEYL